MGSVSSLISGHSFHSKHCRASQYKLRKSSHLKKLNRYSDGLLRFGFSQDSGHGKSSSKMGKSEDFFYIKVSQKARGSHHPDYTALSSGDLGGQAGVDFDPSTPPKLMPFSNQLEMGSEKGAVRPTAFKPVLPRSGAILHSSPESASHQLHPAPPDKPKEQELKPGLCSGALSDSGRNSMSSLPTHSTSSSYQLDPLVTPVGPTSRFGGSAHNITQGIILQDSNMMSLKALSFSDGGSKLGHPNKADKGPSCVRSPISTDECSIQELEQKLLEREGALQKLQRSFEEKEFASSLAYEERPRRCRDEPEGPEPKGGSKLKQASQKSQRAQQVLHLQVLQLQQEKRQLRQELESLMKEQDLLETKLRSYEREKTSFGPALEETQWEVCQKSGEISLLKQQLKESQTEVNAKASEILGLKAQLKDTRGKLEGLELRTQDLEGALRTKGLELEVCENELQRKKNEAELLREKVNLLEQELQELRAQAVLARDMVPPTFPEDVPALQRELERLRAELREERQGHDQMSSGFQHERLVWKEEKEKVIQYQKQLQQSYVAMYQRNQRLEKALQQLARGDSAGEPLEVDLEGADIPYEDIIATEI
ncbi:leucine zipper putative tumor suppressor 1 [Rhinopithecus roxellana]|uniref:Leucine zipper tumor suppressor 1 n=2 Tax=Rhinopithecus TaxID=542827 RepID=A0A2K6LBF6_RHIBE|nr:PREDICTED: leucine zipper putative tumor suppressor 1 [Rhinopithecus bieti]XP_030794139.1 leucine zipper putative tumor suppressor 1 [Rhinopithecus roxellana]